MFLPHSKNDQCTSSFSNGQDDTRRVPTQTGETDEHLSGATDEWHEMDGHHGHEEHFSNYSGMIGTKNTIIPNSKCFCLVFFSCSLSSAACPTMSRSTYIRAHKISIRGKRTNTNQSKAPLFGSSISFFLFIVYNGYNGCGGAG